MKRKTEILLMLLLAFGCSFTAVARKQELTLEQCWDMALQHSADARNAALDVKAASLRKQEALAEYFPTLSLNGVAFHSASPLVSITMKDVLGNSEMAKQMIQQATEWARTYDVKIRYDALQHGYAGALTLTQPVYAGGRIVTGNRLAALGIEAARAQNSLQRRSTRQKVQKDFYTVQSLLEKIETLASLQKLLDTLSVEVNTALSAGLATQADATAVKIKRSELKAAGSKLDMGLKIARLNLLNTIGAQYTDPDEFTFVWRESDIVQPQDVYVPEEQAVNSLDEERLLQMQVKARQLEKRMTLGESLPTVAFGASWGYARTLSDPRWNGVMYAMLKVPITDWGKNSRKLQRQNIEIQKAENQREYLGRQLYVHLKMLFMELSGAYDAMMISRESESLAALHLRQLRDGYSAGMNSMEELLRCETEFRQAQESRIEATMNYLTALEDYRGEISNSQL